jgi:hypothetical protein
MDIKDRIIELKRIKASELLDNQNNWRTHPDSQRDAINGILTEIGIADSLIAYYSERNEGKLTLIDGHLRKSLDPDITYPVQITDLNDAEADMLMMVLDPLAGMAGMDKEKVLELVDTINTGEWAVREMLHKLELEAKSISEDSLKENDKRAEGGPPDMELLPFEHYDYIMVMFRNELDWLAAVELFGLERQTDPRKTGKIGLCRVIDGARLVTVLREAQAGTKT